MVKSVRQSGRLLEVPYHIHEFYPPSGRGTGPRHRITQAQVEMVAAHEDFQVVILGNRIIGVRRAPIDRVIFTLRLLTFENADSGRLVFFEHLI